MRKIRVAQIGTSRNSHGNSIFKSLQKQSEIFDIVGYAFPENEQEKFPDRMKKFENYRQLTVDEILKDKSIEAVVIETEEIYLTKYALLAAKSGKHIHMEKPGGVNLNDFEKLISIVKENGKVFHTGYMYRYNPYISELIAKVKSGELGDIISVEAQMNCTHPKEVRQWLENFPGGMMFFLGCHLVDLVLQIQGKPVNIIPYNKASGVEGVTAKDLCMSIFEYENGVSFVKTTAVELGGLERRQLVVNGTKATVELRPLEWYVQGTENLQTGKITRKENNWHVAGEKEISEPCDRYDNMMRAFAQYVNGEKENPFTPDYEHELYKTILKCCGE